MALGYGTVKLTFSNPTYGNVMVMENRDGYYSMFAHFSQFMKSASDAFKEGDIVAMSGNTGRWPKIEFTRVNECHCE